ncbi:MAG: hypothetical protein MUO97_03010 [Dehalococcoidia bacterium]|nr:hypothetical protein [Dehalococcoidia bacterium]
MPKSSSKASSKASLKASNTFKYVGLASAIIGGTGGLYFAFYGNLFMAFVGVILFFVGLFAINKG